MAIKISNNTIIDDSRNLINATSVGIGTTNATSELTVSGNVLVNNWNFPSTVAVTTYRDLDFSDMGSIESLTFSRDLRYMYVFDNEDEIYQLPLSVPGDVSTASTTNYTEFRDYQNIGVGNQIKGAVFHPEGNTLYMVSAATTSIYQLSLNEPWQISTLTNIGIVTVSVYDSATMPSGDPSLEGLWFKPDGTKFYFTSSSDSGIWQYSVDPPWDLSGTVGFETYIATSNVEAGPDALAITSDGKYVLLQGGGDTNIDIFELAIPWEVDSGLVNSDFNMSVTGVSTGFDSEPLFLSADGRKFYIGSDEVSLPWRRIYQFNLDENKSTTKLVGQTNTYGTLNSHQELNSYGLLKSTGSIQFYSINDGPLAGFRNAIMNGDFSIAQRGTSFTHTETGSYNSTYFLDRWYIESNSGGSSITLTQEDFTLGQTEVPGAPNHYLKIVRSSPSTGGGNNSCRFGQGIEGVTMFAGQTVTISFYARSSSGWNFGTVFARKYNENYTNLGDDIFVLDEAIYTTNWRKYTYTTTIKPISPGDVSSVGEGNIAILFTLPQNAAFTLEIAQVQLELGSVATPFEKRPPAIEYDLCRRYYQIGGINEGGSARLKYNRSDGPNHFNSIHYFSPSMYTTPSVTISGTVVYVGSEPLSLGVSNITKNQFTTTVECDGDGIYVYRAYNWSWEAFADI